MPLFFLEFVVCIVDFHFCWTLQSYSHEKQIGTYMAASIPDGLCKNVAIPLATSFSSSSFSNLMKC